MLEESGALVRVRGEVGPGRPEPNEQGGKDGGGGGAERGLACDRDWAVVHEPAR